MKRAPETRPRRMAGDDEGREIAMSRARTGTRSVDVTSRLGGPFDSHSPLGASTVS